MTFATKRLPDAPDVTAPDGCDVRILLATARGSMAHFTLEPGRTSRAVVHQTVEEIWFVTVGNGEMWRRDGTREEIVALRPGTSITIPVGTRFQFRANRTAPLSAVAITMPPWPGADEAEFVEGVWRV